MGPATEPSIGLLPSRPKFGFRFVATETLEGHWPTQQQSAQQPEFSPEVTMGRCGLKCPHSLTGPREPHTYLPLYTWDLERYLLVYPSSQQNQVASDFAA